MKFQSPLRGEKSRLHGCVKNLQPSTFNLQPESAVALVITLILLSVITFMTVTFLVVSRSEHNAVATTTDQAAARNAADTALQYAELNVVAPMIATTNDQNYGLTVSTNYINPWGFNAPGATYTNLTNVSYTYYNANANPTTILTPVTGPDRLQMIANLFYFPRVPVYVTNQIARTNEDRTYYDINRNQKFDQTGIVPVLLNVGGTPTPILIRTKNPVGQWMNAAGQTWVGSLQVGDPQWVGILNRPDFPHSSSNRFVARYAYMAVPSGQTLDVNYMHNYAKGANVNMSSGTGDEFRRNEGVGTWEENLAAFLADLNTNFWNSIASPYFYNTNVTPFANSGYAFNDALSLLRYRYNANYASGAAGVVSNVLSMFGQAGASSFEGDGVDEFAAGPLMLGTSLPADQDSLKISRLVPWAGADNPSHFFGLQDFFDKTKTGLGISTTTLSLSNDFTDRLLNAGTMPDTYDQNTFFRMLSQLGTDSSPEPPKMNLNYNNLTPSNYVATSTNFLAWNATNFFYNAAIRLMLNSGYVAGNTPSNILAVSASGSTNFHIQIWPTNYYTPSVHRLLQLTANIYDATFNRTNINGTAIPYPYPPTVFRPMFSQGATGPGGVSPVYITNYTEVTNLSILAFNYPWDDLSTTNYFNHSHVNANDMVYGIPLIIGAKKGWPNFQQCAVQSRIDITRKLQFMTNYSLPLQKNGGPNQTNQMYVLTNQVATTVGLWNSYSNAFPRQLSLQVFLDVRARLTNEVGKDLIFDNAGIPSRGRTWSNYTQYGTAPNPVYIQQLTWGGFTNTPAPRSINISMTNFLSTNFYVMSNAYYSPVTHLFKPIGAQFETENGIIIPQLWYRQNTRLRMYLVDSTSQRIIDYVNVDSTPSDTFTNLIYETTLINANGNPSYPPGSGYLVKTRADNTQGPDGNAGGYMWATNRSSTPNPLTIWTPTYGILNQINLGLGPNGYTSASTANERACNGFRAMFGLGAIYAGGATPATNNEEFFAPTRTIYYNTSWQANDPLVHYTIGDLGGGYTYIGGIPQTNQYELDTATFSPMTNSPLNNRGRYEPWAIAGFVRGKSGGGGSKTLSDMSVKDPMITCSDDWSFPTNKFPNAAWLGRVHRGTPWQTVNFKAAYADPQTWNQWSGDSANVVNYGQFSTNQGVPIPNNPAGLMTTNFPINYYTRDSFFSMPTNDFRLLDIFTAASDDNATHSQLSINQTNLAAWSAVLAGTIVLHDDSGILQQGIWTGTNWTVIQPDAVDRYQNLMTNPPVSQIVNAINTARSTALIYTNPTTQAHILIPGPANGVYSHLGDILNIPQLTVNSPYLGNNPLYLNDAVYEWLPQQIMGLLKCDHTPRFTIYCYGQALKPANHGIVLNGNFAGLCTNYQVTAETATRAVVRIDGAPLNPHAVLESFNVLPPE